jgi:hypothetical protein
VAAIGVATGVGACAAEPNSDSPAVVAAITAPAPWYRGTRTLDLSGDGRPDSVQLVAVGPRPDSLRITLSLLVDGEEKHREEWGSSYELALVDSASRLPPRVDTILRAALDSVLASVVVQRLGTPNHPIMAEDSVTLAELEPRPTHVVTFSYGYETMIRLVWDAHRRRFVRLFSCC